MPTPVSPGQPNMTQLMQQAQKMQADLMAAQRELADARIEGTSGGGLVTATVTGAGELVGLVIAAEAVDPDDTETLADLVLAAVRDANDQAQKRTAERLGPLAGGVGGLSGALGLPGLPGLG
jgi:hypothetical protein